MHQSVDPCDDCNPTIVIIVGFLSDEMFDADLPARVQWEAEMCANYYVPTEKPPP